MLNVLCCRQLRNIAAMGGRQETYCILEPVGLEYVHDASIFGIGLAGVTCLLKQY